MKHWISTIVIILVLGGATFGILKFLGKYAPEAEKKAYVADPLVVETTTVTSGEFELPLTSEGLVETRRDTILSAQVGGRIVEVDPGFEVGARYPKDFVIARIDSVDYDAAVAQSKANLEQAKLVLVQEEARAEQAARDWKKIGGDRPASDLVLRKPFVASAEANVKAAQAALEKAIEDLARTAIKAPFDCRVRSVNLNLGATVAPGGQLGTIYDPEALLIRLPFSLSDYARIPKAPTITLHTEINGIRYQWEADLLWELGEVDQQTLSAYVLAEIKPKEEERGKFRLPPAGVFLKADLRGAVLTGVVKVPRKAIRGQNKVYVLDQESRLAPRELTIAHRGVNDVYVTKGIEAGEKVIETRIELPVTGMKLIESKEEAPPAE